jgi:hypothetical protein
MNIPEIQDELLRLEYPLLLPDYDPDIERYYYLRQAGQSRDALAIFNSRLVPRYPDEVFRTWLMRAYRSRDPAYKALLARAYRNLGERCLARTKRIILYIAEKAESYSDRDVYSTLKAVEAILRVLPPERYEAAAEIGRYHRYAQALGLREKLVGRAVELVRSYLLGALPVLVEDRRRRQELRLKTAEQARKRLIQADWDSAGRQKNYGAPEPLIDLSTVFFSAADLRRIEIPQNFTRLEDQTLAYCVKYWNSAEDTAFERILYLYSRKYGTKNYDVYMQIRRGRQNNKRDEDILASVMSTLVTGYYYSLQGDKYLQRRWAAIKNSLAAPASPPVASAPAAQTAKPAAAKPARAARPAKPPVTASSRTVRTAKPAVVAMPIQAASTTARPPATSTPEALAAKPPPSAPAPAESAAKLVPKPPPAPTPAAPPAAKPSPSAPAQAESTANLVPKPPPAPTPAAPPAANSPPTAPSPAAPSVQPVPKPPPPAPTPAASPAAKPASATTPAQAESTAKLVPKPPPAPTRVVPLAANSPPPAPAQAMPSRVVRTAKPSPIAPTRNEPRGGALVGQGDSGGSVADRLRALSGRSYDVFRELFLAKVRRVIRKTLSAGRGLFFTPPGEAEDLVYNFLKTHYADPYMNWAESEERAALAAYGFDLESLNPIIDECYRRL